MWEPKKKLGTVNPPSVNWNLWKGTKTKHKYGSDSKYILLMENLIVVDINSKISYNKQ
jgi:acyl-CoA-binding protein